jgi:transcriptional regulator
MYQPTHFVQHDGAVMAALMADHPLAQLVYRHDTGELAADPVPLLWLPDADGCTGLLQGHVARANPLWRQADQSKVLAIFQGPQHYISPAWYASKAAHGKVVPTWNYTLVQAHGELRAVEDPVWLLDLLHRLTHRHEDPRPQPWQVDDAPAQYLDSMMKAIVGIEIQVERLEGKWKVSQNRPATDRQGVVQGLIQEGGAAGEAMGRLVGSGGDPVPD